MIKKLETRIANRKYGWDPREDHWTNWDPQADYEKNMLRDLKADLANWDKEPEDLSLGSK